MVDSAIVADLHIHTRASDGTDSVGRRIEQARACGLETIAITDHDAITDVLSDRVEQHGDIEVVTGVEVRADCLNSKVEILGYYVDPTDEALGEILATARGYRRERNATLVGRLRKETGFSPTVDELRAECNGILGRPHFARRLVDEGISASVGAAFDEYLAEDGACYVPMRRLPAKRVLRRIREAGGVASFAHPGRVSASAETVAEMVEELAAHGLDGIEVQYPYGEADDRYANIGVADAARLAETHCLVETGGSDCHGSGSEKFRIGTIGLDYASFNTFERLAAKRRPLT
jgi:predicted metal-dependent phosphoesterase TrpH